ncbi:MAG: hypothetical protein IMZ53_14980 [Thermoplasmata archaeon]|nr:hypothetical protein [Thermoplasmata archaeon]
MELTPEELKALRYQGLMGHEFIVLRADLDCAAECNSLQSAKNTVAEPFAKGGRIYQQFPGRKFKRIV